MKKIFLVFGLAIGLILPLAGRAVGEDIWVIETGGEGTFVSLLGTNYNVTTKTTDEIKLGISSDVELLIYPGGLLPITQAQDADLQAAILDYVNNGGNYFGSCGGSIPGAQQLTYDYGVLDMIGLVQVDAIDYLDWFTTVSYTDGFVFNDNTEINGEYASGTHWLTYSGGPAFDIVSGYENDIEVLATYAANFNSAQTSHYEVQGKAAIVSTAYGLGKVILCAPHPESDSSTQFIFDNMVTWLLTATDYTPEQTQNVQVKKIKSNQVKVKWDTQADTSQYQIKVRNKKGKVVFSGKTTNDYIFVNPLKKGKNYSVKVRAIGFYEQPGPWSEKISFKTKSWRYYHNIPYSFNLKFSKEWKGLKVKKSVQDYGTVLHFRLPTTSEYYPHGYATMFSIIVYTKDQWAGEDSLAESDDYVFSWSHVHDAPIGLTARMQETESIIDTFKLD
ncbi:MAG: BPL-N domain-containing protein [Patescibacteria group bacterium]|jgi:glutamine amidotransferase-like uncharacterized protein